jgi:predicted nucleic acid-binding protein
MSVVVDTSIVAKILFPERYSDSASALFNDAADARERITAPYLLAVEITNVIRKRMRSDRLPFETAAALLSEYLNLPITQVEWPGFHHQALALSAAHSLGVHDAHFVALAQFFGCDLWVDDTRLLRAVQGRLPFVKWIGDYATTNP